MVIKKSILNKEKLFSIKDLNIKKIEKVKAATKKLFFFINLK